MHYFVTYSKILPFCIVVCLPVVIGQAEERPKPLMAAAVDQPSSGGTLPAAPVAAEGAKAQEKSGVGAPFTPAADLKGSWHFKPDPALPNVLILGDSISIGYTLPVRELLQGKANVFRPLRKDRQPDNCGDTTMGLANLDKWLGEQKWDVIHFNWGLWDLCYRHPESKSQGKRDKIRGKLSTTPEDYERNLEKLIERLKKTGAALIFATTTRVPEGEPGRHVGDDAKYNAIACRVMERNKIPVTDLYAVTQAFPADHFVAPGDVHFTSKASAKLAEQVATKITQQLERKVKPLDAPPN